MPVTLQCPHDFPMSDSDIDRLWRLTRTQRKFPDNSIVVRCVSRQEIRRLNAKYRGQDEPTNVLTFSYGSRREEGLANQTGEHDIALCLDVAREQAKQRGDADKDYVALLLVHAFAHVTGLDHERSAVQARQTQALEQTVLELAGIRIRLLGNH